MGSAQPGALGEASVLPLPADEGLRVYVGFRLGFRVKFRGDVDDQVEFHGLMCLVL